MRFGKVGYNLEVMSGPKNIFELDELASRPTQHVIDSLRAVDSNVLVIGAGGKMGFHLSRMLHRGLAGLRSKHRVIAISRFGSVGATRLFDELGIETIPIDLTSGGTVESLPDAKNVFFLAGAKFGTSGTPGLLQQMNVELPARVARRYSDSRIVALSTGCVYSFTRPAGGGSVESDEMNPPGEYASSCHGREQAFARSGAHTSLIRLNYSVDLRYGVLVDLAQKVLLGQPVDVTTGFANVIWQGDANAYIIQALPFAASPPFAINVTGKAILNIREVAQRFAHRFGKEVAIVGVEKETAWLNNAKKSHELWGLPSVSEDELIEWVADWLLNNGETLNKATHFEVRDGKY